ncbi:MAG: FadR family transcriptional regulator [Anaerolineae bacterium]|nr:FadR family transcriptional regulator [Anaerolineae bacterium]
MLPSGLDSDILQYIVKHHILPGERLPTIAELSRELGVSVSKVREELEVARTLGLVQIKPRTGTQVQPFNFAPAASLSVLYALGLNRVHFQDFSKLRNSVELSFWHEAVALLMPEDILFLRQLIVHARDKLHCIPVIVPFEEHRRLHLTFFKRLENPFVQGILQAYWVAYKAFGLALYAELSYHREVWNYHERMVECVAQQDFDGGWRALKEHMELLRYIDQPVAAEPGTEVPPVFPFFE